MKDGKKLKIKSIIILLYIWLCVGFPMGLWVLLAGPSRWLSEYARSSGMEISQENLWGKLIIVGYIIVSFLLALFIHYIVKRSKLKLIRIGLPVILSAVFLYSVYVFSYHPQRLIAYSRYNSIKNVLLRQRLKTADLEFVFGPFPNDQMMKDIKRQGYDGVISLLHELVIPAEPALLKQEFETGEKTGLKVINMPMLPWVSENTETLEKIKQFIANEKGLYYVHCYLGRDRVNVFKSLVEKYNISTELENMEPVRLLEEITQMERGKYFKLEDDVYLTPYPTDEEFFSYVLNGYFKTVVSLLDSTLRENDSWILKEKEIMANYKINYINFPCFNTYDQKNLELLKNLISEQKKPILIHSFRTDDPVSEYIISHY